MTVFLQMSRPNDCIFADDLTHHDLTEKEEAILPAELFREKIIPILINIFHVREMQIRLVLLNFFPNYVGMFTYGFGVFFYGCGVFWQNEEIRLL